MKNDKNVRECEIEFTQTPWFMAVMRAEVESGIEAMLRFNSRSAWPHVSTWPVIGIRHGSKPSWSVMILNRQHVHESWTDKNNGQSHAPLDPLPPLPILQAALAALPENLGLMFKVPTDGEDGKLTALTVVWQGHQRKYGVHAQRIHRTEDLGHLRAKLEHPERVLLLTPYLTADLGRKCLDLGIQFLDRAGNLHIKGPGFHVFMVGNKLTDQAGKQALARPFKAYNRKGLQVIFALLAGEGQVGAAYRELGRMAGVATGTVGLVMTDLAEAGFLATTPTGRALLQPERLVDAWVANYPHKLRPHLHPTRFRAAGPRGWRALDLAPFGAQWGGEVAGDRLTGNLHPLLATIYAPGNPAKLAAALRLRPDPQGDIEILDRFWDFPNPRDYPQDLVPPLLVYADLAASGDPRNADIARMIHARHLHPR